MPINTRETLGEQTTLDKLVAKDSTLTTFYEDSLSSTNLYAFRNLTGLTTVNLSNTTTLGDSCFYGCSALTDFIAPKLTAIGQYSFQNCTSLTTLDHVGSENTSSNIVSFNNGFASGSHLTHLIIRNSVKASMNSNTFNGCPIGLGNGAIYVPEDLLSSYKSDSNWRNYSIYKLSDYPRSNFDSIEDSWETIIQNINNDNYSQYNIGDTKTLTVGTTDVKMQIVYIGDGSTTGEDYDDNGTTKKTKITWLCKNAFVNSRQMNTSIIDWPSTAMYTYLNTAEDGVYNTITNTTLKAAIKPVKKPYSTVSGTEAISTGDYIWLPSYQEVMFGTDKETSGVQYSGVFGATTDLSNRSERRKFNSNGTANNWWLRSVRSSTTFCYVNNNGGSGGDNPRGLYGVVFGFAI